MYKIYLNNFKALFQGVLTPKSLSLIFCIYEKIAIKIEMQLSRFTRLIRNTEFPSLNHFRQKHYKIRLNQKKNETARQLTDICEFS